MADEAPPSPTTPTSPSLSSPVSPIPPHLRSRSYSIGSAGGDSRSRSNSFAGYNRVVVVAVDPSEHAKFSFDWYIENIHRSDDLIVLVHIPEPPTLPTFSFKSGKMGPPVDDWKRIMDDMNAKTRQLEEDYEGRCIQQKYKYVVRGESMKNAGEGVCRVAREEQADLIVIGSRGHGKVKRAFLGSVSEHVVRHSGVPTVVVQNRKSTAPPPGQQ